ncbi:MAG TPA: aminotransferase class I/II-fold pyridoxal phosphate-dependent enzyme [Anaerolineaceae bacterium]
MRDSYLSRSVANLKPSGIRKFFDIVATMHDVISLGIGEPDFTTPDRILEAGIRSLQKGETHYTANAGLIELRKAISENLERLYGVCYDPAKEVMISVGGSEALYLSASAILDPGDEVIIPTPCFVSYQAEVYMAGGVPVELPMRMENNFELVPAELEAAITPRTKAILLGFPSNPTGAIATRETLLKVAEIAEKHDLVVISDEIYDRLVYGTTHTCFASLPGMRERTLTLGGFSKAYAMTGWRIGYAAGPEKIIAGLVRLHQYTIMCAPTTAQSAAITAIRECEDDVMRMVAEYDRRRKLVVKGFNELGLATFEPKGAFYCFPSVACTGMNDEEFAQGLLQEERVAVVPGSAFGAGGEGFVRCSYATSYEKLEEALVRTEKFMRRRGCI